MLDGYPRREDLGYKNPALVTALFSLATRNRINYDDQTRLEDSGDGALAELYPDGFRSGSGYMTLSHDIKDPVRRQLTLDNRPGRL